VAVDLSEEVRHAIAHRLSQALGDKPLPGRPGPPDNWHVTLRFLGSTTASQLDRLVHRLDDGDLGAPFTMSFEGLGAFPRPARATVLWLGISRGADRLGELAAVAEDAAVVAGFAPEDRPFHAHLTLSRIRPHQDVRPILGAVPELGASQLVDEVVVYRSLLGRGPARYEAVDRIALS
jgi:2'-5' RNA ligase